MEKQCVFVCTQERNGKIAMDRGRRELFTKKKKKRVCEICACSSDSASHFVCVCARVCVCVCAFVCVSTYLCLLCKAVHTAVLSPTLLTTFSAPSLLALSPLLSFCFSLFLPLFLISRFTDPISLLSLSLSLYLYLFG